jgi:hypothetical protein
MFRATMRPSTAEITVSMWHWYFSFCMDGIWSAGWSFTLTSRPDATHTEWQIPMSHRYSNFCCWWAHGCPKHVQKINKRTKLNCAANWIYLQENNRCSIRSLYQDDSLTTAITTMKRNCAHLNKKVRSRMKYFLLIFSTAISTDGRSLVLLNVISFTEASFCFTYFVRKLCSCSLQAYIQLKNLHELVCYLQIFCVLHDFICKQPATCPREQYLSTGGKYPTVEVLGKCLRWTSEIRNNNVGVVLTF